MKFDGNLAWKQASAATRANRDLLLALAGVFFFLPSFALVMLIQQPQVPPGATPEQMMAVLEPFIATAMPWFLIGSVVQTMGQLTLIALLGQAPRPTVGEALRKGARTLLSYVVAKILVGFIMSLVLILAIGMGSVISPALGLVLAIFAGCQAFARFIAVDAVVVLEHQLNPFRAIARSVGLTRGNGFRIGSFLFLLVIAFVVASLVATLLFGSLAALTMGAGRTAKLVTGFFTSVVSAVALAYLVAITVAIYRQLAGGAAEKA